MEGANLTNATMEGADLGNATMEGANLTNATMEGADLGNATMEEADLTNATMEGADLTNATMEGADLRNATFKSAKLALCNIDSVNASFADFTASEGLTPEQLDRCFGCAGTQLPDGLSPPDHWHPTELDGWEGSDEAYKEWLADRKANSLPPFDKSSE